MHPALFDSASAALWLDGAGDDGEYVRLTGFSPSSAVAKAAAKIKDTSAITRISFRNRASWFAFVLFIFFTSTLVSQYDIQEEIPGIVVGEQRIEAILRNKLCVRCTHHDVL